MESVEPVDPDKYIVFKREEFLEMTAPAAMNYATAELQQQALLNMALPDAVVIRRQDYFAGPALHAYSNNMAMAARMVSEGDEQKRLLNIADYFHGQAVLSDSEAWKLPG